MTHSSNNFSTYSPCPSSKKIATADGSLTTVAGIGDVKISPLMTLKNVLHVPRLSTNLVSIHKLTQDLCCNVIFYHNSCVFQDKDLGRMIGRAREQDGLYYLETSSPNRLSHSFSSESVSTNKEKIWLHHNRLGHPSFRVIEILFPSLFKSLSVENFHCEVCELAKHKRIPFQLVIKEVLFLFILFTVTFGVHLPFLMFLVQGGLSPSLMTALVLLGFFCSNTNLMLVPSFQISVL